MKVIDMRTENRLNPLGVDTKSPVFSWRVETKEENWYQDGYRVLVTDGTKTVWDSGLVKSGRMNQVEYAGEALRSDRRYTWQVEVMARSGGRAVGTGAYFETGLFEKEDWKGVWIGEKSDGIYHLFRKGFRLEKDVREARLFICGLGHQVTCVNGAAVRDAVLEAGWTDYRKTCLYSVYDVTALLHRGENGVCVKLGDGMYHVPGGRYVYNKRSYGLRKLLAQLRVTCADGETVYIVTDSSWKAGPSPVRFCCIYGGEDYDGSVPFAGVSESGFVEDESWKAADPVEAPGAVLRASSIPPLRVMERYLPKVLRDREDGFLIDLGVNFSGWVRIRLRTDGTMAGKRIVMTPAEILTPEGEPDQRVTGKGYAWTYFCSDKREQEFTPDFTYTGFRYVKVEGARPGEALQKVRKEGPEAGSEKRRGEASKPAEETLPVLEMLTGEFLYPDMEETGKFTCSNELFNRIHATIRQAMLSNIKSYFTDCPHREKLPWLEETHLIGPAMLCSWDLQNLYEKVEQDMADSQRESGLVADICPEYVTGFDRWHKGFLDSPEWGSACVLNPWHLYRKYGNTRALKRWYPVMKAYVDYLTSMTWHGVLHHGLGDWLDLGPCTPYSQNTPVPVTATCIYYMDLEIMERTAALLGNAADAETYRAQRELVYEEYNRQFLDDQTGRYANGSQACQAMSLMAGLVPEEYREKALRQLKDEVVKRGYAITAGDVGHPYLVAALGTYGMSELLNRMTNITETPGYGYQVVQGATTLTEEWDGPDPKRPHGSQNHLMLGSIDEWFFSGLGGIGSIRTAESFDKITICPHIAEGMDSCEVRMGHPYGQICVSWQRELPGKGTGEPMGEKADGQAPGAALVTAVIPPNLTAVLKSEDGSVCRTVGSGTYRYRVPAGKQEVLQ